MTASTMRIINRLLQPLTRQRTALSTTLSFGLLLSVASFTTQAAARNLPEFNAMFAVHAFNIKLGTSEQQLSCENSDCTLVATAKPSGFASLFVKEYTEERVALQQHNESLAWQSYQKIIHRKDGNDKTVTFELSDGQPSEVLYPEKQRRWPLQGKLYDMASIAYALQFARLNNQPLSDFYLQDTHGQEAITLTPMPDLKEVALADFETSYPAEAYGFATSKAKVKVWLLPEYSFFPAKIEVYNTEADKTIILVLEELPELL
ncbi:DUF3108 domain-containing protein [Thiomicrorhabdus cannonii]|uniref:DUF3108 domain-containing protein n=1 Tax=Thiomicrorhabdus cannonii TaxID=2748011 RepID=UPI0015C1C05A|nr:DUF3108 domain-containing protein [Thiomicrorhabdus cannonii]